MFARAVQRVALQKTAQRSFAAAAPTKKDYVYSAKIPGQQRGNWAVDEREFPEQDKKWFYLLILPGSFFGGVTAYKKGIENNRDTLIGDKKTIAIKNWEEGKCLITGERKTFTLINH